MERIVDKLIALACCVPALALAGTGFAATGALLAAVTCAFLAELLPGRASVAPAVSCCLLPQRHQKACGQQQVPN